MNRLGVVACIGGLLYAGSVWGQASGDPRRIGVRPTGSYWGAAGEQIDLRCDSEPVALVESNADLDIPFRAVELRLRLDHSASVLVRLCAWSISMPPIKLTSPPARRSHSHPCPV